MIEVKDITAPELDVFARLTEAQLRNKKEPEKGIFIAESPKVIRTALESGCEPVSFLMERRHMEGDARELLAMCPHVPVYTAQREVLEKLTGYVLTRGVLCAMRRPAARDMTQVLASARRVAVLEGVVDSTNIGAIFRSAAALGMDAVLLTSTCCDPLNRRAVRVSMGTVFQVPWAVETDWMPKLREHGFKTAAMALDDRAISIEDESLGKEPKLAVFMGTEGDGLNKATIEACDYTVMIPMYHGVDSLNVAAASAVAFWQLRAK
ncbi:MAG: RNA methyltransferase [Oscillospiraceae bacterium]|nr:RNA methyltransferase [Oscillospiraceae bacterium]